MTESIDPARPNPADPARSAWRCSAPARSMLGIGVAPGRRGRQSDDEDVLTEALVLRDPDIPVAGNADGDITIVEYFDYQCPYCRKIEPELRQVVQDDGKVRLVLKDWPILGPVSVIAARMALASKYQDKYVQAHEALIGVSLETDRAAHPRTAGRRRHRCRSRSTRDLAANAKAIDAILARNNDQATAFGFKGTPSFIVGKFRVPGVLTMAQFDQVDRRCAQGGGAEVAAANRQNALVEDEGASRCSRTIRRDYFDDSLIQSSCARAFSAFQSVAATSQLTMVRLACATWPLATVEVDIES